MVTGSEGLESWTQVKILALIVSFLWGKVVGDSSIMYTGCSE